MKSFLKKLARNSGTFKISSWFNKDLLTIITYHCLLPYKNRDKLTHVDRKQISIEKFEEHLKIITRYGSPISLQEAVTKKTLPPHAVVVTFDDGYKNNFLYAFPLLKKYNVPATIFVTTGFIDQTTFIWPDRLAYIIENAPSEDVDFCWGNDNLDLKLKSKTEKIKSIRLVKNYLKGLSESQKLFFIDRLQNLLGVEYEWSKISPDLMPLTWEEIRVMRESGLISIGSHTVTHPILSQCTVDQQRQELKESQRRITEKLGAECNLFAYPNGRKTDYNLETIRLLKELNYIAAVTVIHGYVEKDHSDNFQLHRFGGDISLEALGTIVSGLSRIVGTI